MPKTSTERVRAFRESQRAQKPAKTPPKSGLQRLREFRAKQRALKSGVALNSVLPAAQSSAIDNVDNTANPSTSNDASTSAERTSTDTSIPYTNFIANNSAHREFNKKFFDNSFGFTCGICDRP
jgi:hypothetical protein